MKKKLLFLLFVLVASAHLYSEETKPTHFGIYAGGGWVHYFDNMEIYDVQGIGESFDVQKDNACFSAKFVWEPAHRISVGIESGYYKLYEYASNNDNRKVTTTLVPILWNVNMRIIDNVYLGVGTGAVILNNKVDGDSKASSSVLSFSNFHFMGSYRYPINRNWAVGAEARYMWIGKTNDNNMSIQALVGYRF